MKYKITEIKTDSVKAVYEDGSWAEIPIQKTNNASQIQLAISSFNNNNPFDKVADVPVTISTDWVDPLVVEVDEQVDYKTARAEHYPPIGNQLDALYWAREGDDTASKAMDTVIKEVKTKIPKGTTYKQSEVAALLD